MAEKPLTDWNSGLYDCCQNRSTCCYGFCCCPCLACTVSGEYGEDYCLPLCDMLSPAILAALGIPLIASPAALSIRVGIRKDYRIKGSVWKDILVSCACSWCAWYQMHQELEYRKKKDTAVNAQPIQVAQPAPVTTNSVIMNAE